MTWDEYYEKVYDWATSTAVNKISSIEEFGSQSEVIEVIGHIGFDDEKGATRLLNKALAAGMKFTGEQLMEIDGVCQEDVFRAAIYQSADQFTQQDLEEMYCCVDDSLIIDLVKKFNIPAPPDITDEYADVLEEVTVPLSWKRFYDSYCDWDEEYAKARIYSITDFGNDEDEIIEVLGDLYYDNEYDASIFIQGALDAGIRFGEENLNDIASFCNGDTTRNAVIASNILLSDESLEELYGIIDDDVIIEVAQMSNLKLPKDLRDEYKDDVADVEDLSYEIQAAINSANYAIDCLNQVQYALDNSSNIGVVDMLTSGFFPSLMKHASLEEAERELRIAQTAIDGLNGDLKMLMGYKSIKLSYPRLTSVVELWFDSSFWDCLSVMQINKLKKNVYRVGKQIEDIRRELQRML